MFVWRKILIAAAVILAIWPTLGSKVLAAPINVPFTFFCSGLGDVTSCPVADILGPTSIMYGNATVTFSFFDMSDAQQIFVTPFQTYDPITGIRTAGFNVSVDSTLVGKSSNPFSLTGAGETSPELIYNITTNGTYVGAIGGSFTTGSDLAGGCLICETSLAVSNNVNNAVATASCFGTDCAPPGTMFAASSFVPETTSIQVDDLLTLSASVAFGGPVYQEVTSFSSSFETVPEPPTLVLLGMAIAGIAGLRLNKLHRLGLVDGFPRDH